AGDAGVAKRTLERAKATLGVQTHREGGQEPRWVWALEAIDETLLRHLRERERDERLWQIRRETAHATPGDPWTPQRETTSVTWRRSLSAASSSCRSPGASISSARRTSACWPSWSSSLTTPPRAKLQPKPLCATSSSSSWEALSTGRPAWWLS